MYTNLEKNTGKNEKENEEVFLCCPPRSKEPGYGTICSQGVEFTVHDMICAILNKIFSIFKFLWVVGFVEGVWFCEICTNKITT